MAQVAVGLIALCAAVVGAAALGGCYKMPEVPNPTVDGTGYPSPGPTNPARPVLTITKEEIADQYVADMLGTHQAVGDISVVAIADVFPEDASVVEVIPQELARGEIPDVLILMKGTFASRGQEYPAHLIILDRAQGQVIRMFGPLEKLREMVP